MPLYSATCPDIAAAATLLGSEWGVAPVCILACAGYADQHWQLWHPRRRRAGDMPAYVLADGLMVMHPDCPALVQRG